MKTLILALSAVLLSACGTQPVYYHSLSEAASPNQTWCAGNWVQRNGQTYCEPKTQYYPYYGYPPYYGPVLVDPWAGYRWGFGVCINCGRHRH